MMSLDLNITSEYIEPGFCSPILIGGVRSEEVKFQCRIACAMFKVGPQLYDFVILKCKQRCHHKSQRHSIVLSGD